MRIVATIMLIPTTSTLKMADTTTTTAKTTVMTTTTMDTTIKALLVSKVMAAAQRMIPRLSVISP
jgi:hypothetical protein